MSVVLSDWSLPLFPPMIARRLHLWRPEDLRRFSAPRSSSVKL